MPRKKSRMASEPTHTAANPPGYPKVAETYNPPWDLGANHDQPTCINSLKIRRYRVTVELIDEPIEVLRDRVRKMWRETRNYHYTGAIREAAFALGIELDQAERGVDAPERGY